MVSTALPEREGNQAYMCHQAQSAGLHVSSGTISSVTTCYGSVPVSDNRGSRMDGHSPSLVFMDIIVRDWGNLFLHEN